MGIETLHKAALAAGFAMATPDDDPPVTEVDRIARADGWQRPGQWLLPVAHTAPPRADRRDLISAAAAWVRDHLPLMGGRAPA